MLNLSRKSFFIAILVAAGSLTALFALGGTFFRPAAADNQRAVTIHDGNKTVTVATSARSVGEVLQRAKIEVGERDMVEPAASTELIAPAYTVNVYRARPITIVDGATKVQVMSPYQSPRSIVMSADITLHPEDVADMDRVDDFVSGGGPGLQVEVDRATPVTLVLYGKQALVRTQAKTVGELMQEKNISLGEKDDISVTPETPITKNLVIDIWRDGVQTKTEEKAVAFEVETIQDADREVGYKEVKTKGVKGKRMVTYQIELKNGKEVAKKEIQSVVVEQPRKEVVIVGAKPSFSGDFAAALAKLRSCEGGYDSWNPAGPYYGAYQFDRGTWASSAPTGAEYGNATPAQQDQAARNLYERRGWQPWPVCGADLPDIYR